MSKESRISFNQILMLVVSPPFLFLALSCFISLISGHVYDSGDPWGEKLFQNRIHIQPIPFWFFIFPYAVLFYFRKNENIFFQTKLVFSASMVVALLDPLFRYFDWTYLFTLVVLTAGAMWGLFWEMTIRKKDDGGKYPLAIDPKRKKGIPTESLDSNVEIVGGTGTGKTRHVIKPFIEQTIEQGLGCFIYDVKSNLGPDVTYYAEHFNRSSSFYYFDIARPKRSATYNPLYGDNPDEIANRVFTALYYDKKNAEPYYMELASAFIHNLVGLLMKEIKTITFQDLATAAGEIETFRIIGDFCAKYPNSVQAGYFKSLWLKKSSKQRQEELSGLVNKLQRFCNREWSHLLNVKKPSIKMENVLDLNQILLFGVASAQYPEDAKPLSILAMMDLSSQVAKRFMHKPMKPFRVFLDEFYNISYPGFIDLINKCREAKVNLFLAHQSLGDLRAVSEEFMEQVMNTARNKIVLGLDDPQTAEYFAKLFGTTPDLNARVTSYDAQSNVAGYAKPMVEKFRFHPNDIKELPVGQGIVRIVSKGKPHIVLTALGTALEVPSGFVWEYRIPGYQKSMKNETSIERSDDEDGAGLAVPAKKGGKGPGGASMGDADAA